MQACSTDSLPWQRTPSITAARGSKSVANAAIRTTRTRASEKCVPGNSCEHATCAARLLKASLQTEPHTPSRKTSSRPPATVGPPVNRTPAAFVKRWGLNYPRKVHGQGMAVDERSWLVHRHDLARQIPVINQCQFNSNSIPCRSPMLSSSDQDRCGG
eukprot:362189-Chlamydomonas_euryale.AAC.4